MDVVDEITILAIAEQELLAIEQEGQEFEAWLEAWLERTGGATPRYHPNPDDDRDDRGMTWQQRRAESLGKQDARRSGRRK